MDILQNIQNLEKRPWAVFNFALLGNFKYYLLNV